MITDLPLSEVLAQRFDSLWQWLSRKYRLETAERTIGGRSTRLITIADADQALDAALAENDENPAAPYWATLWPAAVALSEFIATRPDALRQPLLETGCGMGLPGITAGHYIEHIILSDSAPDALRLAELNWIVNHQRPVVTQQIDWRQPSPQYRYPLILAADVAYETLLINPLVHTLDTLLSDDGAIWLSEPNRPIAKPLFDQLTSAGFVWEKFIQNVTLADIDTEVAVYIIRRN